jgi:predicted ATPase/DNA-binding NarL/FixJ family response regulator
MRVVLLSGEPGIGKTQLLRELAQRAAADGIPVLYGGASEAEGMPPYLPLLEALGQHIRATSPDILHAQVAGAATTLAALLPELVERLGALPDGYPLPPEQARLRLYEAIGGFLTAIATPRSLVLQLDDLQWADAATLDLLCHIARHQPVARLLVVGAYREGEVAEHVGFQRAVAELNRLRLLSTISIGPLAEADLSVFAAEYLGGTITPLIGQVLFKQSEGNPFFAEELLRGWLEAGALTRPEWSWSLVLPSIEGLPSSIVGAVRQRLARLPPEVVDLLRIAAIIGRSFEAALLAEVADQGLELVEERLAVASCARLLQGDPSGIFTFGHDTIRESLSSDMTAARRRRLHAAIGQALELRASATGAQPLAELAFHFTQGGDRARGAVYAQQAAELALRSYAPDEALAHYRAALDLIEVGDQRRGRLLFGLGEAATLTGAEHEAAAAFTSARDWFAQAGDMLAAGQAAQRLGLACWRQELVAEARAAFETALALLDERLCAETVQTLVDLGSLLAVSLHQHAEGIAYGRRALELAQRLADDRLLAAASRTVGNLLVLTNDLPAGIALLERALELAAAADDPVEAAECCAALAMAYMSSGQLRRSAERTRQRMQFALRCHDLFQMRHIYSFLAALHGIQGRLAEAEQLIGQAQPIVERLASPEPAAYLGFIRGMKAYAQGDYAAAEAILQQAIATFRAIGPHTLVWYLGSLGLALFAQEKRPEALACMAELEMLVARLSPGTLPTALPLACLAAMALALGDQVRIVQLQSRLVPFSGQFHDALIDRLLGQIATRQGDWAGAERLLAAAVRMAEQEDIRFEIAPALEAQADLELARGGRGSAARASRLIEQALASAQRLGNPHEARRLRERLDTLGGRSSQRPPPLPAGLSEREAEVLRLVARGMSNREIAQALILSEKTVANHLTNIFTKTGAGNRTAATAFAIRCGLA